MKNIIAVVLLAALVGCTSYHPIEMRDSYMTEEYVGKTVERQRKAIEAAGYVYMHWTIEKVPLTSFTRIMSWGRYKTEEEYYIEELEGKIMKGTK